jgi:DNA repair exonuclease SbcCD ATPase subunit
MKKVNFNKISIKNFLSFGNEPVVLEFKRGLHVITGVNRDKSDRQNGLGKSAMMESLYFAIFGTTIRELKKDLIPNSFTNGSCEVILNFDVILESQKDEYKLVRTINPTKLFLYKNGEDITRDSIKNTEEYLHNLINASPSIFENCVIMTLNNTIPFMAKSKVDKRKFIEGIFNLDIFSKMLAEVREEYNDTKKSYEIDLTKMEGSQRSVESFKNQRESILTNRKNKISVYEQRKVNNISEKEKLEVEINKILSENLDELKDNISKLKKVKDTLEKTINSLSEKKYQTLSTISQNESNLKKIGTSEANCPVCLRSIEEHDKQMILDEKNKISDFINQNKESLKKIESDIDSNKQNKKKIESAIDKGLDKIKNFAVNEQKKINIKDRIKQLDIWLSQLDGDIEELKSTDTDVDGVIQNAEKDLEDIKESVNKYRFNLNLLDTVKFIVSEEGVKSYIVKKILIMFNERIRYYLTKLDGNCICNFNQYFEEEIVNEKNKVCSYFNFSGAERKNIDFACLFTFMDMRRLQGDVTYNISIYDELIDSCLDQKGLELVTGLINERVEKYDECVLVISHRKESVNFATGDVIFLEKKDGITSRIEHNPFV